MDQDRRRTGLLISGGALTLTGIGLHVAAAIRVDDRLFPLESMATGEAPPDPSALARGIQDSQTPTSYAPSLLMGGVGFLMLALGVTLLVMARRRPEG